MITASGIRRLRRCAGSAVLPRAETHNEWADSGSDDHEALARWVVTRDDSEIVDIVHEDLLPRFPELAPVGSRPEVKLAYDCATGLGRIIGEGNGRDYGAPGPFEIVGSCDVVGVVDGVVIVLDWKTGFADVAPASENEQLWFYALAACRALGASSARVVIVYTKTNRVDAYDIGALELAEFARSLTLLQTDVTRRQREYRESQRATSQGGGTTTASLDTREGDWCKHCSSKHACPSKNALLVQLSSGGLALVGDAVMTSDRAVAALRQWQAADQLVKDAKKRLDAYVTETGPIDLGNGTSYGRFARKGKESLDGNLTVQAIREVVGEAAREFESVAVDRKVSKASLKRAAEALPGIGRGVTKLVKAVVDRTKELGGVKSGIEYPIGEFPTGSAAPALDMDAVDAALKAAV